MDFVSGHLATAEFDVRGGAGIVRDDAVKAQVGCGTGGGVDAHVAHRAADGEAINPGGAEHVQQSGFAKAVWKVFDDDRLGGALASRPAQHLFAAR